MSFFRRNIGIDVGTSKAVAYLRGRGIIFHEPSVVALDYYNEKIIAVGEEAEALLGRTPGNVSLIKPIEEGVIANFEAAEHLLHYILKKSLGRSIIKPNAILSVPSHITQVQKRALMQACKNAGAYKVFLIDEVLASAFGIGIDIKDPLGQMIIDIGAGSVSIGVVAKGQVVLSVGRRIGGENFNRAIKKFVADKYDLFIGEETTEKIKRTIASLSKEAEPKGMEVGGRSKLYGLPTKIMLNSNEIFEAIAPIVEEIFYYLKILLSKTPPELSADLVNRGAYITGSSAQIPGFVELLSNHLGIPVSLAEYPGTCTVRGTAKAMQWMEDYDSEGKKDYAKRDHSLEKKEILRKR